MNMLSQRAFDQAKEYIHRCGRTLDQARFAFHFADGSARDVIAALDAYQNDDGGFGHALEPDMRTVASSAIAIQQGFNILREVGASTDEPTVHKAIAFLLNTLDQEKLRWPIVPAAVEDAPHAPWWTYAKIEENFGGFLANPRAALIGFLCEHQALVPTELLTKLLEAQMDHFSAQATAQEIEMHDLYCYITLATSPNLPEQHRQTLTATLTHIAQTTVSTDAADFTKYQLLPLDIAPTPDALLASAVKRGAVDAQLDWLLDTQLEDGSWALPWSWDFVDKDAWAQAERDWKGHIAVNRLRTLAAYGRIDHNLSSEAVSQSD